jgi:hypothetical protein
VRLPAACRKEMSSKASTGRNCDQAGGAWSSFRDLEGGGFTGCICFAQDLISFRNSFRIHITNPYSQHGHGLANDTSQSQCSSNIDPPKESQEEEAPESSCCGSVVITNHLAFGKRAVFSNNQGFQHLKKAFSGLASLESKERSRPLGLLGGVTVFGIGLAL